ncbi:MAG: hypothetical protein HOM68_18255 [Gemmatimonadetes bacterium]|jgi:Tol biopolymer transport system component|nr:hypothetical protein [Gemmatimonadota bacterium]MBT4611125.1 hypothetical protein [Gemmatimonadota bacterium]MBT5058489.1 hypothetical protein [Gemmatimonadota bacterium]MBT5144809.1 hypothetical protein [Gemmatimonadota bacterium]MBT5587286.1 hypothetical protein [Gemmatimonadota bacterium]
MRATTFALAVAIASLTGSSFAQTDGKIAFTTSRDTDRDVYVMAADGSNQTLVADAGWHESEGTWSPDGERILYGSWIGDGSMWLINSDGTHNQRISTPGFHLSASSSFDWSPDGERVVVANGDIWIMEADFSAATKITDHTADDWDPVWSPDGRWIAFSSYRHFDSKGAYKNLWLMSTDDFNPVQITDTASDDDSAPTWSPDGQRLAFASDRSGDWEIYTIGPDGTDLVQLTNSEDYDMDPTWSPDGSRIAFATRRDGNWEIYCMDSDGSNQVNLTNNPGNDTEPQWSPVMADVVPSVVEAVSWGQIKVGDSVLQGP